MIAWRRSSDVKRSVRLFVIIGKLAHTHHLVKCFFACCRFIILHLFRDHAPRLVLRDRKIGAGKILSFESGRNIVLTFPVRVFQMNPMGTLKKGGILAGFIDDTIGLLYLATLRKPCESIDITVIFVRAVKPGPFVSSARSLRQRAKRYCKSRWRR